MPTKLLLADDSVTIHKVVGLTFAGENVQIVSVTDGDAAIERVRAIRPDVVLADVCMPGRNGYEVCATIKSDPELDGIPVVLLVGTFEPFDEIEAARVKCDAYLTKPFDTSELIGIVRSLSGRKGTKKAAVATPQAAAGSETLLVSERTRESFLGAGRILDVFDFPIPHPAAPEPEGAVDTPVEAPAAPESVPELEVEEIAPAAASQVIPFPGMKPGGAQESAPVALSEDMIDQIVEKVVRRMSQDVVREIAWEVVPELSESMIRQFLNELKLPDKK